MNRFVGVLLSFLVLASMTSFAGCGGSSAPPPPPPSLEITSAALPAGTMNSAYGGGSGFALAASGGVAPYKWSWAAATGSTLPPGLNLSNGLISGSPTTQGPYNVVVTVSDSQSPVAQTSMGYSITINDPKQALAITSGAPPAGTVGTRYDYASLFCLRGSPGCVCTSGGDRDVCRRTIPGFITAAIGGISPYTWSWTAGAGSLLPPSLSISSDGLVSGIPTKEGTYNVVVTVTDSASPANHTSASYPVVITPPPPPVISTDPAPAIGTINVVYVGYAFLAVDGHPPYTWSETGPLPKGMTFGPDGALSGTPTETGAFPISVTLSDSMNQSPAPAKFTIQVLAKGFVPTGKMATVRALHTATLLADGRVLVAGGTAAVNTSLLQAALYDPAKGTFASTNGSMLNPRVSATATLLKSGKVLIAGGADPTLPSAELYDPARDSFALTTGNMATTRINHTATLLTDGTVLITGGLDNSGNSLSSAELFDATSQTFTSVGNMATMRGLQTATLLPGGKVLIAGGLDGSGGAVTTAELYDPSTKTFSSAGNMSMGRAGHTATLLTGGKVLLAGGAASFGGSGLNSAEIYDPAARTFTPTNPMVTRRAIHTATLLSNGQVLLAGGVGYLFASSTPWTLSAAELFDPTTGNFTATADMTTAREADTATLLSTGDVLVIGGSSGTIGYSNIVTELDTAELYQ